MALTGKIRRDFISCKLEGCINASICFRNNIVSISFLKFKFVLLHIQENVFHFEMINKKMAKNR